MKRASVMNKHTIINKSTGEKKCSCFKRCGGCQLDKPYAEQYNVPLVKTQMKKIIVTAKTLYSHPKNVSKIYAALHTDLAW